MDKENRPKINVQLKSVDWVLVATGWLFLFLLWGMAIYFYRDLPDTIPTHYNGKGIADGFGSKRTLFSLPGVASILFIGLMVLNRYPHLFNYPVEITAENAQTQYMKATRLLRVLALVVVVVFSWIQFRTIQQAMEKSVGLGKGFMIVFLAMIILPLLFYLLRIFQDKNNPKNENPRSA